MFFYGPPGSRRENFYDKPLGDEEERLTEWAWMIRQKEKLLGSDPSGFAQGHLSASLHKEKNLWRKIKRILREHGAAL